MIDIFNVSITGELVINKEAVRAIPEFKAILVRDKGSKGDAQGRAKAFATKELLYVYYRADLRSRFRKDGVKDKDIHRKAIGAIGLPQDYKVDEVITNAISKYQAIQQDTPSLRFLNALNRGLVLSSKVVDAVVEKIEEDLEYYSTGNLAVKSPDFDIIEDTGEEEDKMNPNIILPRLISNMKEITTLGAAINKSLATVKEAEDKVKKELQEEGEVRGGGQLGNREIPQ